MFVDICREIGPVKHDGCASVDIGVAACLVDVQEDPALSGSVRLRQQARTEFEAIVTSMSERAGASTAHDVERDLLSSVLGLACTLMALFLALSHERLELPTVLRQGNRRYVRHPAKRRTVDFLFGPVRYARHYYWQLNGSGGFFPLDARLGLTADAFSLGVLSTGAWLAAQMSYQAAKEVMTRLLGWAPSVTTLEGAVLGLGPRAGRYLDSQGPAEGDGDTLVIQIDGKGIPTATDAELEKRRKPTGERKKKRTENGKSIRHEGRKKRRRAGPKPRRAPGDKSKNARVFYVIVLYTLRKETGDDGQTLLVGPINKRVTVGVRTKRNAVELARKLADQRGFASDSGKSVQVVTDGDTGLTDPIAELFPTATRTLDAIHATERLWSIARLIPMKSAKKRAEWVAERTAEMYAGAHDELIAAIEKKRPKVRSKRSAGTTGKSPRELLDEHLEYLRARRDLMQYRQLSEQDLEIGTGIVEGAVGYVVGHRFDRGGMRWIKERAAALLYLRCVIVNGDWDDFLDGIHRETIRRDARTKETIRLVQPKPAVLQ